MVKFSGVAVPVIKVGKPATEITMEPTAAGQWTWAAPDQLVFQPKADWPVGQRYKVSIGRKALAPNVSLKSREFEFQAPAFTIDVDSAEFYQDPVQVNLRRVVYQLRFSHPVNTKSLEGAIRLDEGDPEASLFGLNAGASRKFTVTYDVHKLLATVMSEPLPIPAQTQSMRLSVAAGVTAHTLDGKEIGELTRRHDGGFFEGKVFVMQALKSGLHRHFLHFVRHACQCFQAQAFVVAQQSFHRLRDIVDIGPDAGALGHHLLARMHGGNHVQFVQAPVPDLALHQ